jgi:hypothetical protein
MLKGNTKAILHPEFGQIQMINLEAKGDFGKSRDGQSKTSITKLPNLDHKSQIQVKNHLAKQ